MSEQGSAALRVEWQGERRFEAIAPDGGRMRIDCAREVAPGPMDALLAALASCAAIDVTEILAKRRTPARALHVHVQHTRAAEPPRRLTSAHLHFVADTDSAIVHVERAIALVLEGYCSVSASLDPSIPITYDVELQTTEEPHHA
jgi:putative redox protein